MLKLDEFRRVLEELRHGIHLQVDLNSLADDLYSIAERDEVDDREATLNEASSRLELYEKSMEDVSGEEAWVETLESYKGSMDELRHYLARIGQQDSGK